MGGGVVTEKQEVSVTSTGGDVERMEVVESTGGADVITATTEAIVESSVSAITAATTEAVAESSAAVISSASAGAAATSILSEVVHPVAMFYTEEMRSVSGEPEVVEEGFRVVGPQGSQVPQDVLEEAGHPEKQ